MATKVRNLSIFPFGTKPTSRSGKTPEIVIVLRGKFKLVHGQPLAPLLPAFEGDLMTQGSLSGELYAEGDEERVGEIVYPGDFADFKPRAEVMLRGSCHPPGARPTTECLVTLELGSWRKKLRVFGTRAWSDARDTAVMSPPLPFSTMPLDWSRAFGGPASTDNPIGKGMTGDALPHIEGMGEPIRARSDRPAPGGFGPINPSWPLRARKLGKDYGPTWQARRAPWYAEDLDWTYFQAAAPDQQLDAFPRGDETLRLVNLHPRHPVLESRLPGTIARAFVRCQGDRIREVPMNLDTVFVDVEAETVALTWRGLATVAEDDLADVETLLLATERLGEPLPASHYHRAIEELEADPLGLASMAGLAARRDEGLARLDASMAAMAKIGSGGEATLGAEVAAVSGASKGTVGLATALRARREQQPDAPDVTAGLKGAFARPAAIASPPAMRLPEVGKPPAVPGEMARDILASLARAKSAQAESAAARTAAGAPPAPPDFALKPFEDLVASLGVEDRPFVEPGPGRDLRAQDYRGRDLRDRDLSGSDLEAAILTGADLRGASLRGCNLTSAVLHQADLRGANLAGAKLRLATFTEAKAEKATFRDARFDYTQLSGADLSGADLRDVEVSFTIASQTMLSGVTLAGAVISDSLFEACSVDGADLSGSKIAGSMWLACNLAGASFQRAELTKTSFLRSSAAGAVFRRVSGSGVVFFEAKLDRADFTLAVLRGALFTHAEARAGVFCGADLKGAVFYRAVLDRADFSHANLFNADLRKATIQRTRFVNASLFQAVLLGAGGRDTDFSGANLARCISGPG